VRSGPYRTAIVYDFDGTLAPGNLPEHSFIPQLGMEIKDFWKSVKDLARKEDADEILMYMRLMLERADEIKRPITEDELFEHGKTVGLFLGLETWFDRVNQYAKERNLILEHYIISSGLHEMIRASPIYPRFRSVFASRFMYKNEVAVWPAVAINYTTKTQFLFRINKGIENTWDNESVNRWVPYEERSIPFERMIFIGDGETDIPSMKMVRAQGGNSIAVFDKDEWSNHTQKIYRLIAEDRCQFVVPADYSDGSQLDITTRGILGRIARDCGYRGEERA